MLTPWITVIPLLIGFDQVSAFSSDPYCSELKTPLRADDCCEVPEYVQKPIVDRCVDRAGKENRECIEECIAKHIGVLKNGTIDKTALAQLLADTLGKDANFAPIVGVIFDKCYLQMIATLKHNDPMKNGCKSDFIINCIDSGLFKSCPANVWKQSEGCAELKENLAKGCPFTTIRGEEH